MELPDEVTVRRLDCVRCGYQWYPTVGRDGKPHEPKVCPRCRAYEFWRERRPPGRKKKGESE